MIAGANIKRRDFKFRCGRCKDSKEPGWLSLGGGDWVQCPFCEGGYIQGTETRIEPTRKIFLGGT